ncbi:hypothetical protein GGS20DRAFT_540629 [Poronia punctata]|nr:hypothetical protein GGS20DRAFT_540629 [Poronia punctata]
MTGPTSSAFHALQAHFKKRQAIPRSSPGQTNDDEGHLSRGPSLQPGQTQQTMSPAPQLRQTPSIPSYYIDPQLVADDDNRDQNPFDRPPELRGDNDTGRESAPAQNWDGDLGGAGPHRTIGDEYPALPHLPPTQPQWGSNYPALPGSSPEAFRNQHDPGAYIETDGNFGESATDALLQRQLDLQDGSDQESEWEDRQGRDSRYSDPDDDDPRRRRRGKGRRQPARRGQKRGPRKAAEPTGDVKYRINMASEAYMNGRLDEAIEWAEDAIRINAETYRAWTLLASLLEEKGDLKGSFTARVFACHLQPKHVEGWLHCAEIGIALRDELPDEASTLLEQSAVCYSAALRADINNRQARHGRAAIAVERRQYRTAAKDYLYLLERCEYDVHALRSYAEMTILLASAGKRDFYKPESAIEWYRRAFSHFQENGTDDRYLVEWQDIDIFASLLAYIGHTKDALYELKSLARWLLGRQDETFWDDWQEDDREWDVDNARRLEFEDYHEGMYPESSYGGGLPLELRTKLAVYRLKLGDLAEAERHIRPVDPEGPDGAERVLDEPHLVAEVASALYEADLRPRALRFFEPLLSVPDVLDSAALLAAGRCYLDAGDQRQAEECFGAAIDADESNDEASIDARYELAKMYEAAREEQEAYILVNEALRLQQAHDDAEYNDYDEDDMAEFQDSDDDNRYRHGLGGARGPRPRNNRAPRPLKSRAPRPLKPKPTGPNGETYKVSRSRPRRKVFARTEEVTLEEKRRAEELAAAWRTVHDIREAQAAKDGRTQRQTGPSDAFMQAAKELVDDFRSCKGFYSWEKYLIHLGIDEFKQVYVPRNRNLIEMKERLSHNLNPYGPNAERQLGERTAVSYRGVSFSEWLDLFLEYAIGLAHLERFQESYQVCESARDAEVFAKNKEDMFLIHVTWAACALRARDEETCVAAARFLMRDRQFDSDPFRMFAALCRLCPSPASWYASGPVQKYMLRQIKLMDRALTSGGAEDSEEEEGKTNTGRVYSAKELDVTLLVLYGHILFVSNSFTYALNYFLRAYSIDPTNQMILLSVGQCYIHYALKRQSENRQYLLVQGFVFLHRYYDIKIASEDAAERQEAHYNMARSYHAIGIPHLAAEYYQRVLRDPPEDARSNVLGQSDLSREAAYNLQQICWAGGDLEAVKRLSERYLAL